MRFELPVVSFVCLGLLLLLSPVFLHSRNVAVISLAIWLLTTNLIHGIDSILWAGNFDVRIAPWCDIVSRVFLASQIALPGCALAFARNLRRCAIGQEIAQKAYTLMQDLTFCLIIPVFYVVLHVIVQPHRFDIVQDFGCSVSIHTSSLAVILIWLPPLIICIATFVYAFLAIRGRLDSGLVFFSHMHDSPRLAIDILAFARPLLTSVFIAVASLVTTALSLYGHVSDVGGIKPNVTDTWMAVHAQMTIPFIAEWWLTPACTIVLVAMTVLGMVCRASSQRSSQGSRVLSHYFHSAIFGRPSSTSACEGESENSSGKGFRSLGETFSSAPSSPSPTLIGDRDAPYKPMPLSFALAGQEPVVPVKAKIKLARLAIPEIPQTQSSQGARVPSTYGLSDDPFVQSTQAYLESPTGREALGLGVVTMPLVSPFPPPPRSLVRRDASPPKRTVSPSMRVASPPSHMRSPTLPSSSSSLARSVSSSPSRGVVLLRFAVPQQSLPPLVPVSPRTHLRTSRVPARSNALCRSHYHHPTIAVAVPGNSAHVVAPPSVSSITTSLASSTISMGAYYDDVHAAPFQDHADADADSIVAGRPRSGPGLARDALLARTASRRVKNASGSFAGGIYMTVVKETETV
ncbi:STE3-domain-containing protein [Epithele typhae]|uniref:STE3-domain-containing protein n=1 Tax=Epithele typhae TaxID=378194 RepID=UPI002008BA2C|nr:STE3-domain-containing protein [Epithele typhae]KAH9916390.1 STE3-domain-containing protein [Epithele typhae]